MRGIRALSARISDDDPQDLAEALEDLNRMVEMAQDEGCPVPTNAMLEVAETQLRRLHGFAPETYLVGPGPNGEILAYARPKPDHSIALTLYADGGALCSALVPGGAFKVSWSTAEEITDAELRQAADLLARAVG